MWMGAPGFRFYLPAAVRFIRNNSGDTSEFVAHFASTLEFRLDHEPNELKAVAVQLVELCDYLIENWSRFEDGTAA